MRIAFWLAHPRLIVPRLRYWWWEKRNPDKPWLCPGTVAFCEEHLHRSMEALEFGSGRSTRWLSGLVGHLTSVEHDPAWYAVVQGQLRHAGVTNVDYRLVPLNHPVDLGEQAEYDRTPDYVSVAHQFDDQSLDFVVVDGHYRTHCVRQVIPKIVSSGLLMVDDINMWGSPDRLPVPQNWQVVDDSTNGIKRCMIWRAA